MPLSIPSRKSVIQSGQAYFQTNVPEWDATTARRSYVAGLIKGTMSALHDWYVALRQASLMFFPQTAQGTFLTQGWWSDIAKIKQNPASAAHGTVVLTGTAGAVVPIGTILTASNLAFTTDVAVTVAIQARALVSLTSASSVAIATTSAAHGLSTGQTVTISGAVQSAYNLTVAIIVTSATTFTYAVTGTPVTPATGTLLVTGTYANATVTCTTKGQTTNRDGGSTLAVPAITNVGTTAYIGYGGLSGGTDQEPIEDYRARLLFALGTDFGMFTPDEITIVAKQIPGVTRVFVRRAQVAQVAGYPLEGQVFVAFMRDLDANPFPSGTAVADVYNQLLTILPAHTDPTDLVVTAPTNQPVNFTFTALSPNTPTMRAAIKASLVQFFSESADYGANVLQDDYRCAIRDTYDAQGRVRLKSFTLSAPVGDVTVGVSSMPSLGVINWP